MNIDYTCYKKLSLKDYLKMFFFHIEKLLSYSSKLKYLNNFFYPTLKKHNFFFVNIEYIY